jgi:hypothetical protein
LLDGLPCLLQLAAEQVEPREVAFVDPELAEMWEHKLL